MAHKLRSGMYEIIIRRRYESGVPAPDDPHAAYAHALAELERAKRQHKGIGDAQRRLVRAMTDRIRSEVER